VLSGRGLCDELITCPKESYRLWCVVVCDLETSRMRRSWSALGRSATGTIWSITFSISSLRDIISFADVRYKASIMKLRRLLYIK
jgi:hypothetical protein